MQYKVNTERKVLSSQIHFFVYRLLRQAFRWVMTNPYHFWSQPKKEKSLCAARGQGDYPFNLIPHNLDGFVKSPSAALRFIFSHCGVL